MEQFRDRHFSIKSCSLSFTCMCKQICSKEEMNYMEVEPEDYKNISNHDELT